MMGRAGRMVALAPLFLVGVLAFMALGGVIVLSLWNWLLPPLFGFHVITFWQALGLLVLCRILFGGLGLHGHGRHRVRSRMRDRWETMSPEERDRFRRSLWGTLGFGPPPDERVGE